jgi:tetratricopeptide (TPR) repeat protein
MELGNYTEALELAQRAAQLARSNNMFVLLSLVLTILGAVYRAMLAPDTAQATHLEGLQQYEPMGPPLIEMFAAEVCSYYALAGAWEKAHAYAQRVLELRTDTIVLSTKLALWYETEALVRAGEMERATEDVERFGERIGSSRRYRIPYLRALAVRAQCRVEIDVATRHLQEAATLAEEIGLPGELWSIQAALADLYLLPGDTQQADSALKQAATLVQKLADNIENDEQKANFLASPLVRRV